jgi:hypothetical protein
LKAGHDGGGDEEPDHARYADVGPAAATSTRQS